MKKQKKEASNFDFETTKWENYYSEALNDEGQESEDLYFMKASEQDGVRILERCLTDLNRQKIRIAELACGAARVSIDLAQREDVASVTLLDGSKSAIDYAKRQTPQAVFNKMTFMQGDLFNVDLPDQSADLVWNSGVVEHYSEDDIIRITKEMSRVSKDDGTVVIAIPNRKSIAAMKALILGKSSLSSHLNWVSGYRYDTEIPYSNKRLSSLIEEATGIKPKVEYAGSPAWAGASKPVVELTKLAGQAFGCSFMTYFVTSKNSVDDDNNQKVNAKIDMSQTSAFQHLRRI